MTDFFKPKNKVVEKLSYLYINEQKFKDAEIANFYMSIVSDMEFFLL